MLGRLGVRHPGVLRGLEGGAPGLLGRLRLRGVQRGGGSSGSDRVARGAD